MFATSARVDVDNQQRLANGALFALCLAYLTSGIASGTSDFAAAFFPTYRRDFSVIGSFPFIIAVGLTPFIAFIIRRRPAWFSLVVAHSAMLIGAASLLIGGNRFATTVSLSLLSVGHQVVAATLLIVAWRARSSVTAVLAGVFVLPRVLNNAVVGELWQLEALASRTRLLTVALFLLLIGLAAVWVTRGGETGGTPTQERSLGTTTILATSVSLVGFAIFASLLGSFESGPSLILALLAPLAGFVILGATHQNRKTQAPAMHLNWPVIAFCALALGLGTCVSYGSRNFGTGQLAWSNPLAWVRAMEVVLVLTAIPLVIFIAGRSQRLLSAGALTIAAAGLWWAFFVLGSLEIGLIEYLLSFLLVEWGGLIVLGGAITFALDRVDEASVEAGIVIFLAVLVLVESLMRNVPYRLIGDDLIQSNFEDTDALELFTVASAFGLIWIAAWLAFRPGSRPTDSTIVDDDGHVTIDP